MPDLPPAVVVTGATSGIGAACVHHLVERGFRVFAGTRQPADRVAAPAPGDARIIPVRIDVTDAAALHAAAGAIAEQVGAAGLAGLVNNAGIAVAGPLEYLPIEALRRQLEVNVIGPVAVTQALLPLLRQGQGRVIMMGSIAGRVAAPFTGPYHASKFGLAGLTDALRLELRPWGIPVVLIEPGVIATPIWSRSAAAAGTVLEHLPPVAHERYGALSAALLQRARRTGARGLPAGVVARVVGEALTTPRPKTRYLIGTDAHLGALVARLPDRLRDWLIARRLRRYLRQQGE